MGGATTKGVITIITLDTVLSCQVPLNIAPGQDCIFVACGTDVPVGCSIMYTYNAADGCSYSVFDSNDNCLAECVFNSAADTCIRGGGFTIDASMSYIKFSTNATLLRTAGILVADIIKDVTDVVAMRRKLEEYNVDDQYHNDIVDIYLDNNTSSNTVVKRHNGEVYLSIVDVDPVGLFGGTWRRITDVFPSSIYAWSYVGASSAICGTFLCGDTVAGQ